MILEGMHLSFSYGEREVLHDISLSLGSGELVMLVGPNGSGKSTLLKILAGFLEPSRGQVLLDKRSLASHSWRSRACRQAFLSQENLPALDFTVRECVMLGRNPHLGPFAVPGAADDEAVDRAIELMELTSMAARPLSRLSGGERQRAMLAAVLAQRPECLLLDEPTSALDVRHALMFVEILRSLREHCGILMVTHDLGLALRSADRVLLLQEGRCAACGGPDEVMTAENLSSAYGCKAAVVSNETFRTVVFYR